jgi:hypothetical protein
VYHRVNQSSRHNCDIRREVIMKMSDEINTHDDEILWPKAHLIHPNFLNYLIRGRMSDKIDEYIEEIGVKTDREFKIHELQLFSGMRPEIAGNLADGIREVK